MAWFRARKIFGDKASVSQQLKLTRLKKNLELAEAAAATNVNARYLAALEAGDYKVLPAGIYGLNYLRAYADFLDLDYEKLLRRFKEEQRIYQSSEQRHLFARQTIRRKYFMTVPNVLKYAAIAMVALLSLGYLWFLIQNIFLPPKLEIISPAADQSVVGKPTVVVAGRTDKETEILINDRQAMVSAAGEFSEEINLHPGVNIITVVAQKAAKTKNVITREILYKTSPEP